jgi:hypothetical protein
LVVAPAREGIDWADPSAPTAACGEEVGPTTVAMAEEADLAGASSDDAAWVEGTGTEVFAGDEPVTELTVPATGEVRGESSTLSAPALPEENNTIQMNAVNRPNIKNAMHLHTRAPLLTAFELNLGGFPVAGVVLKGTPADSRGT